MENMSTPQTATLTDAERKRKAESLHQVRHSGHRPRCCPAPGGASAVPGFLITDPEPAPDLPPGAGIQGTTMVLTAHREEAGVRSSTAGSPACRHSPRCPAATAPDRDAARTVAAHPEQGWSLLCNGIVLFDDTGEFLPDGCVVAPRRASPARRGGVPAVDARR
jgi:hypothetical protein